MKFLKRRSFRIRTLLGLIFVACCCLAFFRSASVQREREREIFSQLGEAYLSVRAERQRPFWANVLPEVVAAKFDAVVSLSVSGEELLEDEGWITEPDKFEDQHVELILELPKLKKLDLGGTSITDRAIERLCELGNLEALRVSDTQVTPKGRALFRRSRPDCLFLAHPGANYFVLRIFAPNEFTVNYGAPVSAKDVEAELAFQVASAKAFRPVDDLILSFDNFMNEGDVDEVFMQEIDRVQKIAEKLRFRYLMLSANDFDEQRALKK